VAPESGRQFRDILVARGSRVELDGVAGLLGVAEVIEDLLDRRLRERLCGDNDFLCLRGSGHPHGHQRDDRCSKCSLNHWVSSQGVVWRVGSTRARDELTPIDQGFDRCVNWREIMWPYLIEMIICSEAVRAGGMVRDAMGSALPVRLLRPS